SSAFQTASESGAASRLRRSMRAPSATRPTWESRARSVGRWLFSRDRALGPEVATQVAVEARVPTADPFQEHGCVLLLLVAVVPQDVSQLRVLRGVHPLLVPVDGLQLLHEAHDRPVHLTSRRTEPVLGLVKSG